MLQRIRPEIFTTTTITTTTNNNKKSNLAIVRGGKLEEWPHS